MFYSLDRLSAIKIPNFDDMRMWNKKDRTSFFCPKIPYTPAFSLSSTICFRTQEPRQLFGNSWMRAFLVSVRKNGTVYRRRLSSWGHSSKQILSLYFLVNCCNAPERLRKSNSGQNCFEVSARNCRKLRAPERFLIKSSSFVRAAKLPTACNIWNCQMPKCE